MNSIIFLFNFFGLLFELIGFIGLTYVAADARYNKDGSLVLGPQDGVDNAVWRKNNIRKLKLQPFVYIFVGLGFLLQLIALCLPKIYWLCLS